MLLPRLPCLVAVAALAAVTAVAGTGCGGTKDDRPPQWSFISATIIEPSCATVNCHSAITHQGGVDLSNAQIGYETLVKNSGGMTFYVYPKYPQYSQLITLLNATGSLRMPPDNPLPQADIALIEQWISDGADPN
ncbi:MAG TPA: hypothetical protein VI456_02665 [Polyangia bacterium]